MKDACHLLVALITNRFKASNPIANEYEDDITFTRSVNNLSNKDIRAFDGTLYFTDLSDNLIMSSSLAINDPVRSATTLMWKGAIKYNQFIDRHQRLRNAEQANMKISFTTTKILFQDSTTKEYSEH
jgi:hypothetical protein